MAKRKRKALARKKTASKRGKARTRAKSAPRKAAKRARAKTKAKKTATRAGRKARAKKAAKRVAVKARAALKKAAPRPTEPPRKAAEIPDETLVVDIIEEPVPGVVVVTEFEAVRTSRPETPAQRPEGGEGSGAAEREEEED